MVDLPPRPGPTPRIAVSTVVPSRRMSLSEEDAFPVTQIEIKAPPAPENLDADAGVASSPAAAKGNSKWVAIVFVVVAAIGALAAARFFVATSRDTPAGQE